ncbi:MAG: carbohydrate ABC transporter permease [Ruminococcaceae bacterium]|nr:carbohydrate ABC transporter permease [Oscillospiraceae bacterium]
MDSPKVLKDNKRKIKVDFERTSLKERLKAKYLTVNFLVDVVWKIFRLLLLIGISYIIIFPFISKIFGSFMSKDDLIDATVRLIPKYPTLDTYKYIIRENGYFEAFFNTFILSTLCAFVQTIICSIIGYGLAKFKFRGNKLVFMAVILTMIVPHDTIKLSMYMNFKYFDIYGIYGGLSSLLGLESSSIDLINSYWPMVILSIGGIAFKNGLYIFMMRQFFKGVPDELEEAAYIDGENTFGTFVKIILPISIPMMITIFLFAFSWQWTDNFYTDLFFTQSGALLMPRIVKVPPSLAAEDFTAKDLYNSCITNTCGLLIILPLMLFYSYMQRYLIQGIERSGIVG